MLLNARNGFSITNMARYEHDFCKQLRTYDVTSENYGHGEFYKLYRNHRRCDNVLPILEAGDRAVEIWQDCVRMKPLIEI